MCPDICNQCKYFSPTDKKTYYYAGGQQVAIRVVTTSNTLYFLLGDHLGSTSITATARGGFYSELRYLPWGGTRYSSGTTPTTFRYTGQREAEAGLYYYGARFYDPGLGRFVSADTVTPQQQGTQAWDRYAGMNNNPVRYTDPTGNSVDCGIGEPNCYGGRHYDSREQYLRLRVRVSPIELSEPGYSSPDVTGYYNSTMGLTSDTSVSLDIPISSVSSSTTSNQPAESQIGAGFLNQAITLGEGYGEFIGRAYPMYHSVRGILPTEIGEGFIQGGLQLLSDGDLNLSGGQRLSRAVIAFGEGLGTDATSTVAAAAMAGASSPSGPGAAATYAFTSVLVTELCDQGWSWINQNIVYPLFGLEE